jgi:hypothetical protein
MPVETTRDERYGEVTKYKCDFCKANYSNQGELREHIELEHKVSEQLGREPNRTTRVLCKVCGLGFEDSKKLYILQMIIIQKGR